MKKLILIIALLCISTSAMAVEPIDWSKSYALSTAIQAVVSAGGAAGVSGCTALGSSATTGGTSGSTTDYAVGSLITTTGSCKINKVYLYDGATTCNTYKAVVGIYATSGGYPTGAAIATSSEMTYSASAGWKSAAITETTLSASTTYALIFMGDGAACNYYLTDSGKQHYMSWDYSANFPTLPTWSGTSTGDKLYSVYVIYE
jgi:hypothetical protein